MGLLKDYLKYFYSKEYCFGEKMHFNNLELDIHIAFVYNRKASWVAKYCTL